MERSRTRADCVVVTLSNFFQQPYEIVHADLEACKLSDKENIERYGYCAATWKQVIKKYNGGKELVELHPRRGQEKLSGIVQFARPQRKHGHLTYMLNGQIFDTDGRICSIESYRKQTGYNVKGIVTW